MACMEPATDFRLSPTPPIGIELVRPVREDNCIRRHKVEALKRLVQSGNYHVNLDKLADRLLNHF